MDLLLTIFGSRLQIAKELGAPYQTVVSWGAEGRQIPPRRFAQIIAAAKRHGHDLTYEQLQSANAPAPSEATP